MPIIRPRRKAACPSTDQAVTAGLVAGYPRSLDPYYALKEAIEVTCDGLNPGDHFYVADEFSLSLMQTLQTILSPRRQQVIILGARSAYQALRYRGAQLPYRRDGSPHP